MLYNVLYDDGDTRHRVPRRELLSVEEFLNEFKEEYFKQTSKKDPSQFKKEQSPDKGTDENNQQHAEVAVASPDKGTDENNQQHAEVVVASPDKGTDENNQQHAEMVVASPNAAGLHTASQPAQQQNGATVSGNIGTHDASTNATEEVTEAPTNEQKPAEQKQVFRHPLLGRHVMRRWTDVKLRKRTLGGTVKSCWQDLETGSIHLNVSYWDSNLEFLQDVGFDWNIPNPEQISEELAWGARQLFEAEQDGVKVSTTEDIAKWKWIVPDRVIDESCFPPKRRLLLKNVTIELEARQSGIQGAGLGVFVKLTPTSLTNDDSFVLKSGEMIDLGVYSPYSKADLCDHSQLLVKSFIFDGKPEEWAFDSEEGNHNHGFDITNNTNGDLHDLAKRNVLVYVNETDGKQPPSVEPQRDPASHVHYLLGPARGEEQLSLEYGKWIELLIDYGAAYERIS